MKHVNSQILAGVAIVVGLGLVFWFGRGMRPQPTSPQPQSSQMMDSSETDMTEQAFNQLDPKIYSAQLEDVTQGATIRGITTNGQATGTATAFLIDQYQLQAEIENLPQPSGTDFYEGWIVRSEPLSVISTGRLQPSPADQTVYINQFQADQDLSDHTQYVLTLEPDDGDPAPADHIVDGTLRLGLNQAE